jgi:DNA polymerase-3 subunit delta'
LEIRESRSADVAEIDGASNRGIDSIKALTENVRYSPIKSRFRVYIIDEAHMVTREGFNALLKTLEEPPPFVHLVLITSEPAALLETVRSRCQTVRFAPLTNEAVELHLSELGLGGGDEERRAAARLAGGDTDRAAFLLGEQGRELRGVAQACVAAALSGELADAPWGGLLGAAEAASGQAAETVRARFEALAVEAGEGESRGARRRSRETEEATRRAARRARTEALDLGLALIAAWLRDVAAVAEGAESLVHNSDRLEGLRAASARTAGGLDSRRARAGAELVMETRRRLRVNVGEELALEALVFRLEALLRDA